MNIPVVERERRLIGLAEDSFAIRTCYKRYKRKQSFSSFTLLLHFRISALNKSMVGLTCSFDVVYYESVVPFGFSCGNSSEGRILCFDFHVVLQ